MIAKTTHISEIGKFTHEHKGNMSQTDLSAFERKLYAQMLTSCYKRVKSRKAELVNQRFLI